MKLNDLKKHYDKVTCSSDFKNRMEDLLSSEPDGEYADSVSHVEQAPKFNIRNIAAIAASALIVLGIGGIWFSNLNVTPDTVEDPAYKESETTSYIDYLELEPYSMDVCIMNAGENEVLFDIGHLPAEASIKIISDMKDHSDWVEVEGEIAISATGSINISCTGKNSFEISVYKNGFIEYNDGEETKYYTSDYFDYYRVISAVAPYIPYCSWSSMVGNRYGAALDEVFAAHTNEIKRVYTQQVYSNNNIFIFNNDDFSFCIDCYGGIIVYYNSGYGAGTNTLYFESSAELFKEVEAIFVPEADSTVEASTAFTDASALDANSEVKKLVRENLNTDTIIYVSSGKQLSYSADIFNVPLTELSDFYIANDWEKSEKEFSYKDFFAVGQLMFTRSGEIYSTNTGTLYVMPKADLSILSEIIDNILLNDDISYIKYLLASWENRVDYISGNSIYSLSEDDGIFDYECSYYLDNLNNEEYIYLDNIGDPQASDVNRDIKFYMRNGKYGILRYIEPSPHPEDMTVIEDLDGIKRYMTTGYAVMESPEIELNSIRYDILGYLNEMNTYPEYFDNIEIKYVADYENLGAGYFCEFWYNNGYDVPSYINFEIDESGTVQQFTKSDSEYFLFKISKDANTDIYSMENAPELDNELKTFVEEGE